MRILRRRPELTGGLGFFERGDEIGQSAVVDSAPALRRRNGKADRQMRLADARRAEEDDVLLTLQEAELVERVDLLALDRGLEAEVEVVEGLDGREPARAHGSLKAPIIAQHDLSTEELLDGF